MKRSVIFETDAEIIKMSQKEFNFFFETAKIIRKATNSIDIIIEIILSKARPKMNWLLIVAIESLEATREIVCKNSTMTKNRKLFSKYLFLIIFGEKSLHKIKR